MSRLYVEETHNVTRQLNILGHHSQITLLIVQQAGNIKPLLLHCLKQAVTRSIEEEGMGWFVAQNNTFIPTSHTVQGLASK